MSTPLATPLELGTFLQQDIGNTDPRALLLLELAQDKAEQFVSPLPAGAKGVVLSIAARAYNNITSAHQMNLGSAGVSFGAQNSATGVGGLYVSKSDKAELLRLTGRGGAFSVDPTPADAGQGLPVWGQNATWLGPLPLDGVIYP